MPYFNETNSTIATVNSEIFAKLKITLMAGFTYISKQQGHLTSSLGIYKKKVSEYDQEIPQSQTADNSGAS